ncbi:MAG: protein translocase subunit SecF [Patescibacteria group bacterium]|jgi:preprotein translocase subunit SecF
MSLLEKFPFIKLAKFWLVMSSCLLIASFIAIGVFGLKFGIDFTGGSLLEISATQTLDSNDVRTKLSETQFEATVQTSSSDTLLIRTETLTTERHNELLTALENAYGTDSITELRYESIGPTFGVELRNKSLTAVVILSILIIAYIAWAFRHVSKPVASWKYGVITIIAGLHDIILPIGVFAVMGHFYGYQIDTAFIAAILTIMGYSINDTIVVFDRTRENLHVNRHSDLSFGEIVNKSLIQTFARSINTTLTTLLTLVAIFFFGGETTRPFVLALIIGITSGAYSSIFIASPLLVLWEKWQKK